MRQMLVHPQQIYHRGNQDDATTDAQKAHQHTDTESQQENDQGHVSFGAARKSSGKKAVQLLSSPVPPPVATILHPIWKISANTGFFCFCRNCYIYVSLPRYADFLLALWGTAAGEGEFRRM